MAIRRASLVSLAVDELVRIIIERGLREGDGLPSEAELAEELEVSRTVVREAIAELAGQGVIERRQGREALIVAPDAHRFERLLRLRFAVTGSDLRVLQEFRAVVEVGAARLAASRATDADIASLAIALDDLRDADDGDDLHHRDQAFHRELARIAGNDMVLLTLDAISPLLIELRRHAWAGWVGAGGTLTEIVSAHESILERVRAHDPVGAESAMGAHLRQAESGLEAEAASGQRDATVTEFAG